MNDGTTRRSFLQQTSTAMGAMAFALSPAAVLARAPRLDDELPVLVAGLGRQGRSILSELQKIDGVRVAAICDVDPGRLRSGGRRARGAESFADPEEMIRRVDAKAIFIATPTHAHRPLVEAAIAQGLHVYCEAPIAHTIDEARAIVRAARGGSTIVQAGLLGRVNPIYSLAYSFYRSGSIRDVVAMRAQHHRKTSWRAAAADPAAEAALNWRLDPALSIGLAGEWGTHQLDVLHWYAGRYPVRITGGGSIRAHDDGRTVADTIACTLEYDNGLRTQYDATLANSHEGEYERIDGTMGSIRLAWTAGWLFKEADAPTQGWEVYANRQKYYDEDGITLIADATKLAAQGRLKEGVGLPNPPLYYGVEAFVKSIAEGDEVLCTIEEGLRATAVGILANRAVTTGEPVEVTDDLLRVS